MSKSDILIALDREISLIDAGARDEGHLPHQWKIEGTRAVCYCRACGGEAVVRVYPNEKPIRVWSAGRLKTQPCKEGARS